MIAKRFIHQTVLALLAALGAVCLGNGIVHVQGFTSLGTLLQVFSPFLITVLLLSLYTAFAFIPLHSLGAGGTPFSMKVFSLGMALAISWLIFWLSSTTGFTLSFLVTCSCIGLLLALVFLLGRTPLHGFYISLLLIPMFTQMSSELPQSLFHHIPLGPVIVTPAILLVVFSALVVGLTQPIAWDSVPFEPLFFFAVGSYLFLGLASCFRSPDLWPNLNQWLLDGLYPLLGLFIVLQTVQDERSWKQCFEGIMFCAAELALLGWYFFVRPNPGDVDVRNFYGANLSVSLPSANLAQLLVLFLPAVWVAASQFSGKRKVLFTGVGALFLASIALSYSRSAQMGMLLSLLLLLKFRRLRLWILALAGALLLFSWILPTQFKQYGMTRFSGPQSHSLWMDNDLLWRAEAWRGSFQLLKDHPWGVGIGQWARFAPGYTLPRVVKFTEGNQSIFISSPHNLFLNFAIETGWIGLACLLLLFGCLLWSALRPVARPEWAALQYGAFAGLVAFLVSGFFAANFFSYRLNIVSGLLFWSFAGLIVSKERFV